MSPPEQSTSEPALTAEAVLELLYRRDVATMRSRRALARTLGLSDEEVAALFHLAHGELKTAELRELLDLSSGGATAFVHRLLDTGHARRRDHPHDRRSSLISLAPATAAALEQAEAPVAEGIDEAIGVLDEHHRAVVARFLERLVALAERQVEPRPGRPSGASNLRRPVPSLWG